jgi:type IV pilus assembly protein PilB
MTDPSPYLRPVPAAETEGALARAEQPADWDGITRATRRGGSSRFLTDVIQDMGFVSMEKVQAAIEAARQAGTTPEAVLLEQGALSQDHLSRAIAARHGLDHLDLTVFHVDMVAANLLTSAAAKRYDAVPVAFAGERALLVAMADPANVLAIDDVALMTGYEVKAAVASREDIAGLITRLTRLDDVVASTSF